MTDILGWRKVIAVIGPSTNTVLQAEMEAMRPTGVSNQYRSIVVADQAGLTNGNFMAKAAHFRPGLEVALESALSCRPDYLVLGGSVLSFFDGLDGANRTVERIRASTGLETSLGSLAMADALSTYGGIKRLALLSPYFPVANEQIGRFFADSGFEVVRATALRCTSWTGAAQVTQESLRATLRALDGDDIDAIVQVGNNLAMSTLAAQAEAWLGKPVISTNTASYWHALRSAGVLDRFNGYGRLFSAM